ncbi:MAG: PrsW family intramembrane metalloprotease [Propionibacteriaceae bacterium]|jgi:RsiW-degrading membrane proteinase PrsW (M82 family)|nr:PrsW family intramembrane metalloprotease [Propionibacteriaceae bacterium]
MVAIAEVLSPEVEAFLRRRAGVSPAQVQGTIVQRIVRSKWTWVALGVILTAVISTTILLVDIMADRKAENGSKIPGLNADALWSSAVRAWPTLLFWIVCFILVDRYKPQRLLVWFLALIWGGAIAIPASYYLNTWVGEQMAVIDAMSGVAAIRVAVFVAPFVEEATKACIIFLIVVVDRNRFSSRVSGAVVGGLAGAGFAFTENIVYYARAIVFGSYTGSAGDVAAAVDELVFMRGVLTCFGHPLFTLFTGVGVAFAVASRSKIVRILAPSAGFLMAAFLHMFFNWQVSVIPTEQVIFMILILAWPIVIGVAIRVIISSVKQGRTLAARLRGYVIVGWIPSNYPSAFSKLHRRAWTLFMSLWHGSVIRTWILQQRVTELAMLSEAITRGTVDYGGLSREYDLINEIQLITATGGIADARGYRPYWPWQAKKYRGLVKKPRDRYAIPGAAQGATIAPLKYSAVDPRWTPPT